MQRKLTLSKGAFLWDAGDAARTFAVLESGRLGVKTERGVVGVVMPKMIFGEASLLTLDGEAQTRTAAIVALENDTVVNEYPPSAVKDTFDAGNSSVGQHLLMTLVAQICKNYLLIVATHSKRGGTTVLLKNQVQALTSSIPQLKTIDRWDEFFWTFRFLHNQRQHSDLMREKLVGDLTRQSEAVAQATEMIQQLFKGQDIVGYLQDFMNAEKEKDQWLERERVYR
jgi:CRP-like cAMP-binding protein